MQLLCARHCAVTQSVSLLFSSLTSSSSSSSSGGGGGGGKSISLGCLAARGTAERENFPAAVRPQFRKSTWPDSARARSASSRELLRDTAIRPSVCLVPRRAAALGYRHAGCLQLTLRRTRPRTDVDPPRVDLPSARGISSRRPRGDTLLSLCVKHLAKRLMTYIRPARATLCCSL